MTSANIRKRVPRGGNTNSWINKKERTNGGFGVDSELQTPSSSSGGKGFTRDPKRVYGKKQKDVHDYTVYPDDNDDFGQEDTNRLSTHDEAKKSPSHPSTEVREDLPTDISQMSLSGNRERRG